MMTAVIRNECNSSVNVFLVCSELFHSIEFYVFIGCSWGLFVLLSMSRKVLENKEKRCPWGGGGSTRAGMWCLQSPVPICSRRKWLTSLGCLTAALCDKNSSSGPKHTLKWEREPPLQNKLDAKIKTCISLKEKFPKLGNKEKILIDTIGVEREMQTPWDVWEGEKLLCGFTTCPVSRILGGL